MILSPTLPYWVEIHSKIEEKTQKIPNIQQKSKNPQNLGIFRFLVDFRDLGCFFFQFSTERRNSGDKLIIKGSPATTRVVTT